MNRELKMFFESRGSSSYMTMTCPPEVELVNYELEMMLSNEIKNFLGVSRQMLNGETVIYYNITSRIPLKQVLDKRKLNRKELFHLIEGVILAVRDAAAFRLPAAGIVLEPDYIYVNPASCSPAFMFIPVGKPEGPGIKELLSDLVFHDKIEMSNDNFIQVLLMELNRQPFSLEQLEKSLKPYQKQNDVMHQSAGAPPVSSQIVSPQPINSQSMYLQVSGQPSINPQLMDYRPGNGQLMGKETASYQAEERPKLPDDSKGKEAEKQKFMLPQALVMVVVAASVSFGLFTDERGSIVLNNILAFVIVIVVAEVILYRQIYVNGKTPKKEKDRKAAGAQKHPNRSQAQRPRVPQRPELPKSESSIPISSQPVNPQPRPLQSPIPQPDLPQSISQPISPQPIPQYSVYGGEKEADIGSETEILEEEDENGSSAYLEYYENGRLSRIPLNSMNGVVVGRLKQQVDFAVKSAKVGKVHARFFYQNGQYYVVDINSKNGTYINGSRARIDSNIPYPLHDKDRITLADSEFTIRCSES